MALQNHYKDQRVVYCEYKKSDPKFLVKKQREGGAAPQKDARLDQQQKANNQANKEMILNKFAEVPTGDRGTGQFLYGNPLLIARRAERPVAKYHSIITLKDPKITSLDESNEEHKEILGKMMVAAAKVAHLTGLYDTGYRVVINTGNDANQNTVDCNKLAVHVIGGQQLTWPPLKREEELTVKMDGLAVESNTEEVKDKEEEEDELFDRLYKLEMGFALVVEEMIAVMSKGGCPLVGHNCMYDFIYLYNQFIGPLPSTYKEYIGLWSKIIPEVYDTKVLATKSEYFSKTVLGRVYEKCKDDKRLFDVLTFDFDLVNNFTNYYGAGLLAHYHEAAYDAVMTGIVFAKMLKFRQIEEQVQKNRNNKKDKKGKKADPQPPVVEDPSYVSPSEIKNTKIDFEHGFSKMVLNKVMLNQFDNCACFSMTPGKPDQAGDAIEKRNENVIWVKFDPAFRETTADTLGQMFSDFGDF